jgi:hypothetical protein
LPAIEFADARRIVVDRAHRAGSLKPQLDVLGEADYSFFVFASGSGYLYRREIGVELEDDALSPRTSSS